MALVCTHCGTPLPKDDARYCNNCGMLVPSHPFSPQSLSASSQSSVGHNGNKTWIAMREQNAQQPPSSPAAHAAPAARRPEKDEPPSWMNQLENEVWRGTPISRLETPREEVRNNRVTETPTVSWPVAPIAKGEAPPKRDARDANPSFSPPQLDFPVSEPVSRSTNTPIRELHVKVWEQDESTVKIKPGSKLGDSADSWVDNRSVEKRVTTEDHRYDDLPTGPLVANTPEGLASQHAVDASNGKVQDAHLDAVDKMDTLRMAAQAPADHTSRPVIKAVPQQPQDWPSQRGGSSLDRNQSVQGRYSSPAPSHAPNQASPQAQTYAHPVSQPGQESSNGRSAALSSPAAPSSMWVSDKRQALPPRPVSTKLKPPRPKKSRKPLIIVAIVLLALVIGGGLGAWIVIDQPFSVASVTQPQQTFSNSQLGFSIHYPNGWSSRVDSTNATAHLSDSSQTDLVNIVVKAASGSNAGQYIQQEASQLGMTGLQASQSVSFAGATWQQLKGIQLIKGATYTETLYVAVHNNSLYTIMQLAPQGTYAQEDQIAFAGMRSSFQFI